jgi:hypothetical protein
MGWLQAAGVALLVLPLAGCVGGDGPSTTAPVATPPTAGDVPVGTLEWIGQVPDPGQPLGLAFKDGLAYLSTFGVLRADPVQRIFVIDVADKTMRGEILIPAEAPATTMGLAGMAFGPDHALYAVDMNGRILRVASPSDPANSTVTVWARWLPSLPAVQGAPTPAPMPMDIAFAPDGRAYVADGAVPVIWRVGATGSPVEPWLVVDEGGTTEAVRIAGDTLWYMATSPDSSLFRIPIQESVTSEDVVLVHQWDDRSYAFGFIHGADNRTYVSLRNANEVAVLDGNGTEVHRFPTPDGATVPLDNPGHLAWDEAGRLLVANTAFPSQRADHMGLMALSVQPSAP